MVNAHPVLPSSSASTGVLYPLGHYRTSGVRRQHHVCYFFSTLETASRVSHILRQHGYKLFDGDGALVQVPVEQMPEAGESHEWDLLPLNMEL